MNFTASLYNVTYKPVQMNAPKQLQKITTKHSNDSTILSTESIIEYSIAETRRVNSAILQIMTPTTLSDTEDGISATHLQLLRKHFHTQKYIPLEKTGIAIWRTKPLYSICPTSSEYKQQNHRFCLFPFKEQVYHLTWYLFKRKYPFYKASFSLFILKVSFREGSISEDRKRGIFTQRRITSSCYAWMYSAVCQSDIWSISWNS